MFKDRWVFRTESNPKPECRIQRLLPALLVLVIASSMTCRAEGPALNLLSNEQPKFPSSVFPPAAPASVTQVSDYSVIHMTPQPCLRCGDAGCSTAGCQTANSQRGFSIFRPFRSIKERWNQHTRPRWQQRFLGYPEEFCEPPLGLFLAAHTDAMIASGAKTNSTLFQCDFLPGTAQLNAAGLRKLIRITDTLTTTSPEIVIEATPQNPDLAERRRATVATWLANNRFHLSSEQIIVKPLVRSGLNSHTVDTLRRQLEIPATSSPLAR